MDDRNLDNEMTVERSSDRRLEPPKDPEPVFFCSWCDEGVYEGDPFVEIDGERICWECVKGARQYA